MHVWEKIVKTRKPHQCYGCGKIFPPGIEMTYNTTVGEDGFFKGYWCDDCNEKFKKFDEWDWENFEPGTIEEY